MFSDERFAAPDPPAGWPSGQQRPEGPLSSVVAAALSSLLPNEADNALLSELVVDLETCRNLLDAAQSELLAKWDTRQGWADDGARGGAAWMAAHSTSSRAAAATSIRLGRTLRVMPATSTAFSNGSIGTAQARLLAEAQRQAPDSFARDEEMLLQFAHTLRVDALRKAIQFWLAHANPDGHEDRNSRRYASRYLSLTAGFDGMWNIQGRLTADAGEALREAIDRLSQSMYRSDKSLADAQGDPSLIRTAAQRSHDALEELSRLPHMTSRSGQSLSTPSITAVVHVEAFDAPDGQAGDPVGESANGSVITRDRAERHLCECSLSRIVMGPDSTPVDLGVSARLPSPAQRRALAVRYGGCAFPGCDRPPGWTEAHHIIHWARGGSTDLDNLVPLCVFHHHQVHEGGFQIQRQTTGALQFARPDGRPLSVPKHRHPDPGCHPPRAA